MSGFSRPVTAAQILAAGGEILADKGIANGYAGLDAGALVPAVNSRVSSVAGRTGAVTLAVADVSGAQATAQKAAANGYAGLGANVLVPQAQLGTGSDGSGSHYLADDQTYKAVSAGAMTFLSEATTTGSATNISIGSISAAYKALMVVVYGLRSTTASSGPIGLNLTLNGDASAIYDMERVSATGAANAADSFAANNIIVGQAPANTSPANAGASGVLWLPGYADTNWHKTVCGQIGGLTDVVANTFYNVLAVGRYRNTVAVNTITITAATGNLAANGKMQLWGIS